MSLTKVTFSMLSGASVNVMDFGAKGDGTTDDTAAIQAAITYAEASATPPSAAPGVVQVYFPFGLYIITSALAVTKSLSFVGEGHSEYSTGARIIQNTTATNHFTVTPIPAGCSVSWDNLTMTANGGSGGSCLYVGKGCNSVRIRGCTFGTPSALAINLQGSDDVQIDGNLFDVSATNCISLGTSTAANVVSNCSITNNSFFQISVKAILVYNVTGLLIQGNRVYKNPSTPADPIYFIDATNTLPYQVENVIVSGNKFSDLDCLMLATSPKQLVISDNIVSGFGAGSGATLSGIELTGAPENISITGNVFSGSFDTQSFYADSGVSAPIANTNISGNVFTNTSGTGAALLCANSTGLIAGNTFAGFTTPSISESVLTTGSTFTPGTIASLGNYTQNISVTGARQGDIITISSPYTVWPLPVGIQVVAYVSASATVTFEYQNVTAAPILVTAHDWIYTVSRSL
jgi:polygalacturonase